jgi:hypothetical protein
MVLKKLSKNNPDDLAIPEMGCNLGDLRKHLEKQFKSDQSWDNYMVTWSIDFTIPLFSSVSGPVDENKILSRMHWTNARPGPIRKRVN